MPYPQWVIALMAHAFKEGLRKGRRERRKKAKR